MTKPRLLPKLVLGAVALGFTPVASATPSTTYWAPSTTYVQPYLVPHITYDSYFNGEAAYPMDLGVEIGILPFEKVNVEIGLDLILPSSDSKVSNALLLNGKIGIPESAIFGGSPSASFGIFGVGFESDVTDYHAIHGMVQKTLPWGGYAAAGFYYGLGSEVLWSGSDGDVNRAGFMGALASPDIVLDLPGLKKLIFVADIQTGNNVYGAGGFGVYFYFTDAIDLLTGPVFFFDADKQPGQQSWMWTVQLDVDVTLLAPKAAAPAAAEAAPATPAAAGASMVTRPR